MKKIIIFITFLCSLSFADFHCLGCTAPYNDFSKECIDFATTLLDAIGECNFDGSDNHHSFFKCEYGNIKFNSYNNAMSLNIRKNSRHIYFNNDGGCGLTEYDKYEVAIDRWSFNIKYESYGYQRKIYNYFKQHNIKD